MLNCVHVIPHTKIPAKMRKKKIPNEIAARMPVQMVKSGQHGADASVASARTIPAVTAKAMTCGLGLGLGVGGDGMG